MYSYELHMHTAETSKCGRSSARDMVKAYYDKGFSGVVITDHFVNGNSYANDPETWKDPDTAAETTRKYNALKAETERLYEQYDALDSAM